MSLEGARDSCCLTFVRGEYQQTCPEGPQRTTRADDSAIIYLLLIKSNLCDIWRRREDSGGGGVSKSTIHEGIHLRPRPTSRETPSRKQTHACVRMTRGYRQLVNQITTAASGEHSRLFCRGRIHTSAHIGCKADSTAFHSTDDTKATSKRMKRPSRRAWKSSKALHSRLVGSCGSGGKC